MSAYFVPWQSAVVIVAALNAGMYFFEDWTPRHHACWMNAGGLQAEPRKTKNTNISCPGASALQGILTMPLLMLDDARADFEGKQIAHLLRASEFVFPPLNVFCEFSYIIQSILAYRASTSSQQLPTASSTLASARFTCLVQAGLSHILPTAWTLLVVARVNRKMKVLAKELEVSAKAGKEMEDVHGRTVAELRKAQKLWIRLSHVRGIIMTACAVMGFRALLVGA